MTRGGGSGSRLVLEGVVGRGVGGSGWGAVVEGELGTWEWPWWLLVPGPVWGAQV